LPGPTQALHHIDLDSKACGPLGVSGHRVTAAMVPKHLLALLWVKLNKMKSHRGHSMSIPFTVRDAAEQVRLRRFLVRASASLPHLSLEA